MNTTIDRLPIGQSRMINKQTDVPYFLALNSGTILSHRHQALYRRSATLCDLVKMTINLSVFEKNNPLSLTKRLNKFYGMGPREILKRPASVLPVPGAFYVSL